MATPAPFPTETHTSEIEAIVERLRDAHHSGVTRSLNWREAQLDALAGYFEEQGRKVSTRHRELR